MNVEDLATDLAEAACKDLAERVIGDLARARRVNPAHLAQSVPGVAHAHEPTTDVVEGCAFCARRGNVFGGGPSGASTPDIVRRRVDAIREELRALANDIEKTV